jgi:hypothetical protein
MAPAHPLQGWHARKQVSPDVVKLVVLERP